MSAAFEHGFVTGVVAGLVIAALVMWLAVKEIEERLE